MIAFVPLQDYIYSGGDFRIIVASDKDVKISPVREAFQSALGKATVFGLATQAGSVAAQPVGFAAGRQAANERIQNIKNQVCFLSLYPFAKQLWLGLGLVATK